MGFELLAAKLLATLGEKVYSQIFVNLLRSAL